MRYTNLASALLVFGLSQQLPHARGQVTFEHIISAGDPLPNGGVLATPEAPALEGNLVAFVASDPSVGFATGLYVADRSTGVVHYIADDTRNFPGIDDPIFQVAAPTIDQGRVYFWANAGVPPDILADGIFYAEAPTWADLVSYVDTLHTPPCGGAIPEYVSFLANHEDGQHAYHLRYDAAYSAIYRNDEPTPIVDTLTSIPERPSDTFAHFMINSLASGNIGFEGFNADVVPGLYKYTDAGGLECVADTNTPVPGGTGTFQDTGFLQLDAAGQAAFVGQDENDQFGVYTEVTGSHGTYLGAGELLPDGGSLSLVFGLVLDGERLIIGAGGSNGFGVYVGRWAPTDPTPPVLCRITGTGDLVDSKTVMGALPGQDALDGDELALYVLFEDMSEGIYVAQNIPVPTRGDLNCDGLINAGDIDAFILALVEPDAYAVTYPNCNGLLADGNCDALVNAGDIDPFINCLVNNNCGCQ